MIKIEHCIFPTQEQMHFVIEGMRNPMNSWENMDTPRNPISFELGGENVKPEPILGFSDMMLCAKLSNLGEPHRKYMRMMQVGMRITAPLYWWKEFDTYKVGTVRNSCSTMHKIHSKHFEGSDFSLGECDNNDTVKACIDRTISTLNVYRDLYLCAIKERDEANLKGNKKLYKELDEVAKRYWYTMIQLLPSSYNQTANVTLNYETLCNIYKWRKKHKLYEWREFCDWIETVPYHDLITNPKSILEED